MTLETGIVKLKNHFGSEPFCIRRPNCSQKKHKYKYNETFRTILAQAIFCSTRPQNLLTPWTMSSLPQAEVRGFEWKMRRLFENIQELFDRGTTKSYPQTADALGRLRQAIDSELKTKRNRFQPQYLRKKNPSRRGQAGSTTSGGFA